MNSTPVRRYLTGLDWVMASLDREMKRVTGGGNNSQIVFTLAHKPDIEALAKQFRAFVKGFPPLRGRIRRNPLNLAPYWSFPEDGPEVAAETRRLQDDEPERIQELLVQHVNQTFQDGDGFLRALFVEHPSGTVFALSFDHRVLDALGAERLAGAFAEYLQHGQMMPNPERFVRPNSPGLVRWGDKFRGGRFVNRMFIKLGSLPCRRLTVSGHHPPIPFMFRMLQFSTKETDAIMERAWDKAGYLMEMPYFLAAAAQALHHLFENQGAEGSVYNVPVTTDTRPLQDSAGETFFNHASFLFFQLPTDAIFNRIELIRRIKAQMYEQVGDRFPQQVAEAASLLRIAPRGLVGRIMTATMRSRASFSFSYLGRAGFTESRVADGEIRSLFHMPRVPWPPGVGVFFSRFSGRLHITLSCLRSLAEEHRMADVMDRLKKTL